MNISQENIDALNAVVTIDIAKADYEPKLQEALKNYRKKVTMPGFRQGHVPAALVQKMYGKALLADEINKMLGESIQKYVVDNKLKIMGEPLPSEGQEPIDFDKEIDDVHFKFDIALEPEINFEVNDKLSLTYFTIEAGEAAVKQQREAMLARFATQEKFEKVGAQSMVKGTLAQEGGFSKDDAVLSLAMLTGDKAKKALEAAKQGETVEFDICEALNKSSIAYALGISPEEAETATGEYSFTISEITEMVSPAETTQEMRDQLFGKDKVNSNEEFEAKVAESLTSMYEVQQDFQLLRDAQKTIGDKLKLELPEAFLKRWLTIVNKDNEKATPEVIEQEFPHFIEDMKWNLTKGHIISTNNLKVEKDDLLAAAKLFTRVQFAQYGMPFIPEEALENYAQSMLKDKQQIERLAESAQNSVVVAFLKNNAKIKNKKVSIEEFNKLSAAE